MGAYPPGCRQVDHDRYFGVEDRPPCPECYGAGELCATTGKSLKECDCEDFNRDCEPVCCGECHGSGYDEPTDSREDDAYERGLEESWEKD